LLFSEVGKLEGKGFSINFFWLEPKEAKVQDLDLLPHILFFSFESAKLLRRFY